jgi:outer membrane immunogenic protein
LHRLVDGSVFDLRTNVRGHLILRKAGLLSAALFLFTGLSRSQDNRYDVSVNAAAVFTKQSTGNGITQTATKAGGYFATARLRFTPRSSVEVNYARVKNSQMYLSGVSDYRIQGLISEFTGAYVFSFFQTNRLEPFAFGGGGVLVFNPSITQVNTVPSILGAVRQTKPAFLYGAGLDYKIFSIIPIISRFRWSPRMALRLQYRGLVYKAPSFGVQNLFTGAEGHMAEPSIGLVVKF